MRGLDELGVSGVRGSGSVSGSRGRRNGLDRSVLGVLESFLSHSGSSDRAPGSVFGRRFRKQILVLDVREGVPGVQDRDLVEGSVTEILTVREEELDVIGSVFGV